MQGDNIVALVIAVHDYNKAVTAQRAASPDWMDLGLWRLKNLFPAGVVALDPSHFAILVKGGRQSIVWCWDGHENLIWLGNNQTWVKCKALGGGLMARWKPYIWDLTLRLVFAKSLPSICRGKVKSATINRSYMKRIHSGLHTHLQIGDLRWVAQWVFSFRVSPDHCRPFLCSNTPHSSPAALTPETGKEGASFLLPCRQIRCAWGAVLPLTLSFDCLWFIHPPTPLLEGNVTLRAKQIQVKSGKMVGGVPQRHLRWEPLLEFNGSQMKWLYLTCSKIYIYIYIYI